MRRLHLSDTGERAFPGPKLIRAFFLTQASLSMKVIETTFYASSREGFARPNDFQLSPVLAPNGAFLSSEHGNVWAPYPKSIHFSFAFLSDLGMHPAGRLDRILRR